MTARVVPSRFVNVGAVTAGLFVAIALGMGAYEPATGMALLVVLLGVAIATPATVWLALLSAVVFASGVLIATPMGQLRLEHIVLFPLVVGLARTRALHQPLRKTDGVLAVYIAYNATISLVASPEVAVSLRVVAWLLLDAAIWLLVGAALRNIPGSSAVLIRTSAITAAVTGVTALGLWALAAAGVTTWGVHLDHVTGSQAAKVLALEGNLLGSHLAIWFVYLAASQQAREVLGRRLLPVIQIGTGLGILASLSRAAIAAAVIGSLVPVLRRAGTRRKFGTPLLLGVVAVVAVGLTTATSRPLPIQEKLSHAFEFETGTGAERAAAWRDAVDDLSEGSWLVGLGTNSFGSRHTWASVDEPGYISNLPLQVVYDTGVPGALLLTSFFLLILRRGRTGVAATAVIAAFLISSMTTPSLWLGGTWVIIALLYHEGAEGDSRSLPRSLGPRGLRRRPSQYI